MRFASLVVPAVNRFGRSRPAVAEAVSEIEQVGGPGRYVEQFARDGGELTLLELAWRDAEEIAAIADDRFLPASVHSSLERIRGADHR